MDELLNQLHAYGLIIDGFPRLDNGIVRCKTEDKPHKKNGWYIVFTNYLNGKDYITCMYGDWSRDTEGHIYKSWQDDSKLSRDDLEQIRKAQQEAQKKIQLSQKRAQNKAAKEATSTWLKLSETGSSPYLEKKQVNGFGVRYGKDPHGAFFVVPLVDEKGQITSLQSIYNDGQKHFLPGGRIKGCCHIIGDISPLMPLCFAEGYATAASIHQATGFPVVVCFNAGNLDPVIARFRADANIKADRFIICADNDQWKPDKGNPGMDKANDAAKKHGCYIAAPVFDGLDISDKPTDFNDLHILAGADAVKQAIMTDLNDDYAQQASTPQIVTVSKDDPETLIEDEIGYPTERQRPCYRVYEWFLQLDKNTTLKPGVYYHYMKEGKENALPQVVDVWICSPLYVDAITLDQYGNNYGRFLRFVTTLGQWRSWAMPMAMLKGSGEELRGELLSMGVTIDVRNKLALPQYISAQHPKETLEIATHTGWYKGAFILPDRCIGSDAYFFQSEHFNIDIPYRESGTLEDWKQNIARYCVGNPLLMLAVCSAFAGALLKPSHQQGGGFHIFGDSSKGKSTGLYAACSVWGDSSFKRSWRATSNGMEAAASLFNDSLLALDEISECDPKEVGNIIYALGNGIGKQRANRSGGMRAANQWRVMVLSNGELSIESVMMEAGKQSKAGQTLRLLSIALFGQYGAFNTLHDKQNGRELADHLQTASGQYYGVAGVHYLEKLVNEQRNIAELAALKLDDITQGESFNSQVLRAAKRFALVALAGELATEYGVTGWQQGDATAGIVECFKHWRAFYGAGNLEEQQIFNAIKDFIARFGDSRFTGISNPEHLIISDRVNDRAGYWKDDDNGKRLYLFNRPGLLEAINNHDLDRSLAKLKAKGWLIHDKDRNTKAQRVNNRIERFYCIKLPEEVEIPHLKAVV